MIKQQILDALKAKFVGVSDAILNRIADKLAKTVTTAEQVAAAVEAVTTQQLLDSYGDSRATEAQQTAVSNYEKKHGLKDGVKVDPPKKEEEKTPQAGGSEETPAWAKSLIESNKALTDRLNKMEGERTTATRRQQLSGIINKLPENLRKAYERTPVENLTDEEFTALTTEISTEIEGIVKETQTKGAVFGRPATAGNQGNDKQLSKEQQDAIAHRDSVSKDGEQPF